MQRIRDKAAKIKLVIFDVDGVLTDGKLFFDQQGHEYKTFHCRDGLGLKLLREAGVEVAVISGRESKVVALRMASLGIRHVFQGQQNKLLAFETLLHDLRLTADRVAHVGDDLPDLCIMRRVGLAIAVRDANAELLPYADWQTANPGGAGAAREVCDLILEAQGHLKHAVEAHF